ncbi:peptidoglycan recognition protein-like [Macrosteles quadrilineatus]|uniref:peptidoglycan recognition protein-like n=1 Tax=Macrosteles quadrilineatus TaxID=74068 RepID=UPI0023E17BD8|nr:peptidoglycan recognition protein-like [Macrosteles quadrilineatus]
MVKKFSHKKFYKRVEKLVVKLLGHEQMPVILVPRHEWHARSPKDYVLQDHPVKCICVYYRTDMAECVDDNTCVRRVMDMQRIHMEDDDDIMYNFIIGGNEKVFEGRGWFHRSSTKLPWARYHGNRIDIAYIGNYNGKNDLPFQMLEQQLNLVMFGQEKGYIVKNYTMIEETHKFL